MSEKIKPCPFDGGEGAVQLSYTLPATDPQYFVVCNTCAAQGPWEKTRSGALRGWNMRVADPDQRGKTCTECGGKWEEIRPGKFQCSECGAH